MSLQTTDHNNDSYLINTKIWTNLTSQTSFNQLDEDPSETPDLQNKSNSILFFIQFWEFSVIFGDVDVGNSQFIAC